jgi:hypothetical protein
MTTETAESKTPHAVATTTPPSATYRELKVAPGEGVLMYWPEQNAFLALSADEYREFHAEADENSKKIAALQEANHKVTAASIALREAHKRGIAAEIKKADAALEAAINAMQQASAEVKKKLEPLSSLDAKQGVKMVELVSLRTPKYKQKRGVPIYVTSTRLTNVLRENRIYLLSDEQRRRPEERVFRDGKLNVKEIKKRLVEKVQDQGFQKEWKLKPEDADAYTGALMEWSSTMNGDIPTFLEWAKDDPKDSRRNIDLSADAQLMRYTAGAGLEINFKPFKGNLNDRRDDTLYKRVKRGLKSGELAVKANAHASFAIAEGRVRAEVYLPHCAGFHVTLPVLDEHFDLGYWRFYGDITLSGSAGASVAVELDVGITYTGGRQGIRGVPRAQRNKTAVKARAGVGAELDVFAGVRSGLDITGALQWLNPEGAQSEGKPLSVKPGEVVAEYKDVAKVGVGVGGAAGIGVKGAFNIKHVDGTFVVYVRLGACLGLGGDATCKFEVGSETIGEFFKCVAYQLKRADYHKILDVIDPRAYDVYCKVCYLILVTGRDLQRYATMIRENLDEEFTATVNSINRAVRDSTHDAEEFLRRIQRELEKRAGTWLSYAPPEVTGQLALQIATAASSADLRLAAGVPKLMAMIVEVPQTVNHLNTVAERMTQIMGDKQSDRTGYAMMEACVAGTVYSACIDQAKQRLAQAQPVVSKPFIWNNDPDFVIARLGVEHPMYG